MVIDWSVYAILGAFTVGVATSLFKMPSFKGYSSLHSTFWVNVFSLLVALSIFYLFGSNVEIASVSWYGLLWGVMFALTTAQQKILLGRMETNTLLPVTSSLGNVLTVLIGVVLFSEALSGVQYVAVLLILFSVFLYSSKKGGFIIDAHAIFFSIGVILSSTIGKVVQKTGALHESILHFAVYQYIGAVVCAFILIGIFEPSTIRRVYNIKDTWIISLLAGVFMAFAGYAFILALASGPLSGVYPIASSYIFITALLSVWLYGEKLTKHKVLLMLLTFIGVVLIKIGG